MRAAVRKYVLPWTSADCFETEAQFQDWLRRRRRSFMDMRSVFLFLAAACLLAGHFLERRPIMLLTILPLVLVLLLTGGIGRMEALLGEQTTSEANKKE